MAARKMFAFLSDKSWSPNNNNTNGGNTDNGNNINETRRRLSVSRSGRFKEQNKKRIVLADEIYAPPPGDDVSNLSKEKQEEIESILAIERSLPSDQSEEWRSSMAADDLERREAKLQKIRTQIKSLETTM